MYLAVFVHQCPVVTSPIRCLGSAVGHSLVIIVHGIGCLHCGLLSSHHYTAFQSVLTNCRSPSHQPNMHNSSPSSAPTVQMSDAIIAHHIKPTSYAMAEVPLSLQSLRSAQNTLPRIFASTGIVSRCRKLSGYPSIRVETASSTAISQQCECPSLEHLVSTDEG